MKKILTGDETREILEEYGIPVPKEALAQSEEDALRIAGEIGYPVVLKVASPDISNRSKAKCILRDINSEEEVKKGYREIIKNAREFKEGAELLGVLVQKMLPRGKEVVVGLVKDERLTTVVFSLGGIFSDILKDISYRNAPVTREEALKMMKEIKAYSILESSDIEAIADVISKVSKLGMEKRDIVGMDINPLFVYEKGAVAVDSKIIERR
ncbi:MAG: acetate--CoA ligase family protein [Candidatus Hydrothermarchaeota archaeon]|nr:acetate--CoA ligase family protein [Candidatus Hydrothermarchaeota archaeon]